MFNEWIVVFLVVPDNASAPKDLKLKVYAQTDNVVGT